MSVSVNGCYRVLTGAAVFAHTSGMATSHEDSDPTDSRGVRVEFTPIGALVEVVPGARIHSEASVTLRNYRGLDVTGHVFVRDGRVEVDELGIKRLEGTPSINGELLRAVAIQPLIRGFVRNGMKLHSTVPEGTAAVAFGLLSLDDAKRMKGAGPTAETLEWVGKVYRLAEFMGDAPAKAVEEAFGIPNSTARSWIGRARSAGHVGPRPGASQ